MRLFFVIALWITAGWTLALGLHTFGFWGREQ